MPKVVMNYSNTIIYKICCKDVNVKDIYIGHTTNFIKRKNCHKSKCNNPNIKDYNCYVYQFIRNNGGFDNWDMVEIEKYNCNDRLEACKRERYFIEELKASLNKCMPSRNRIEATKYYRDNNKDKINEKIICNICNCQYTRRNKKYHEKTPKHQNNLNNENNLNKQNNLQK